MSLNSLRGRVFRLRRGCVNAGLSSITPLPDYKTFYFLNDPFFIRLYDGLGTPRSGSSLIAGNAGDR
jgi:hypothetical protein